MKGGKAPHCKFLKCATEINERMNSIDCVRVANVAHCRFHEPLVSPPPFAAEKTVTTSLMAASNSSPGPASEEHTESLRTDNLTANESSATEPVRMDSATQNEKLAKPKVAQVLNEDSSNGAIKTDCDITITHPSVKSKLVIASHNEVEKNSDTLERIISKNFDNGSQIIPPTESFMSLSPDQKSETSTCPAKFNQDTVNQSSPPSQLNSKEKRALRRKQNKREKKRLRRHFQDNESTKLSQNTLVITTSSFPSLPDENIPTPKEPHQDKESEVALNNLVYNPQVKPWSIIHVKPLIVLDLNGILCHRVRNPLPPSKAPMTTHRSALGIVSQTKIIPRSDLSQFLHLLHEHYCLAVWTSATRRTAKALVSLLFPKKIKERLLFVWHRNFCDLVPSAALESNLEDGGIKLSKSSPRKKRLRRKRRRKRKDWDKVDPNTELKMEHDGCKVVPKNSLSPTSKNCNHSSAGDCGATDAIEQLSTEKETIETSMTIGDNLTHSEKLSTSYTGCISSSANDVVEATKNDVETTETPPELQHISPTITDSLHFNSSDNSDSSENDETNKDTKETSEDNSCTNNIINDDKHTKNPHQDIIAIKSLCKVWSTFPLWDSTNTLLLDDSPEKCPLRYRANALHPPPIVGTMTRIVKDEQQKHCETEKKNCAMNSVLQEVPTTERDECSTSPSQNVQNTPIPEVEQCTTDDDRANQDLQRKFFEMLAEDWACPQRQLRSPFNFEDLSLSSSKEILSLFLKQHAHSHNMGWKGISRR